MTAGASARAEVERQRQLVAAHERAADEARRRAASFNVAATTELETARHLALLAPCGYHQLADRAWPGSKRSNVDLLLVGPSGVYVVDTKAWADVSVSGGSLWRGQACADEELDKLYRLCELAEQVTAEVGLAPLEVVPVMAFAGQRGISQRLGRVELMGARDLAAFCLRRGTRLTNNQVERVLAALMVAFPPWGEAPATGVRAAGHADPAGAVSSTDVLSSDVSSAGETPQLAAVGIQPVLPVLEPVVDEVLDGDPADLQAAIVEATLAAPSEDWMTFLHPDQAKVVRRGWSGPARIRGAAGTGKTVVGLHRAAYLAATRPGKILYVSYVRTLPVVLGALFERMAPDLAGRVEFTGLHGWATRLLRDRGIPFNLDSKAVYRAFTAAWSTTGKPGPLKRLDVPWTYWRDEIDHVIKGRGLTRFEEYAELARVGRRTRLLPEHRRAMWDLFCAYEQARLAAGVHDFNDVLLMALAEVRRAPLESPHASVIVDEVQDLNLAGVQLLHSLIGDVPDGLLLIGDGQQSVYPGGFTLAEAGIVVTGRSTVLRVNYRNTAEILETATALVSQDRFSDLDEMEELGQRDLEVARQGLRPVRVDARDVASHDASMIEAIREAVTGLGVGFGDLAVLAARRRTVGDYLRILSAAGIPCVELEKYDGRTGDAVKVGTFKRAKGLEFKQVFVPRLTDGPSTRWVDEPESAYRERMELERRELFVGMTRARDKLWLGFVAPD